MTEIGYPINVSASEDMGLMVYTASNTPRCSRGSNRDLGSVGWNRAKRKREMSEKKESLELLSILGALVVVFASTIIRGWVICVLWNWFLSPPLGIPKLSLIFGIGVSLLTQVATLDMSITRKKMDEIEDKLRVVGKSLLVYGFALGLGWIVHLFT